MKLIMKKKINIGCPQKNIGTCFYSLVVDWMEAILHAIVGKRQFQMDKMIGEDPRNV